MAEIQQRFFDVEPVNAETIAEQKGALLREQMSAKAYKRYEKENARFAAEYARTMEGYQRSPHIQTILDRVHAKLWADVKPFLSEERKLLGVNQEANKREVKNAYRRKARKLHPDVGGDEAAFKQLHDAYRRVLAAAKN